MFRVERSSRGDVYFFFFEFGEESYGLTVMRREKVRLVVLMEKRGREERENIYELCGFVVPCISDIRNDPTSRS